jgi:hypothetical protein
MIFASVATDRAGFNPRRNLAHNNSKLVDNQHEVKGISTNMAQKGEYKVIAASSQAGLQKELVQAASQGWKPILMTSAAVEKVLIITVILEHVLGT